MSDGFWEREVGDESEPLPDAMTVMADGPLTADATSVLVGFATGGIIGALQALEKDTWDESGDPNVEDPDALRRAEEAAAHSTGRGPRRPAEDWAPIARQAGEALIGGLQSVAVALQAGGVAVGWDPYDPRDTPGFLLPTMGTPARTFTLLVPVSQVRTARDAVGDLRPQGVTFAWDSALERGAVLPVRETIEAESAAREAAEEAEYGLPDVPEESGPTAVTAYGRFSDNARMERMASGRSPGCALGAILIVVLFIIGAAFLMFAGGR